MAAEFDYGSMIGTMLSMLRDVVFHKDASAFENPSQIKTPAITAFLGFLEKRLGVRVVYDRSYVSKRTGSISNLVSVAETLRKGGVIKQYYPVENMSDEPPICQWGVEFSANPEYSDPPVAGGASFESDQDALIAALAEALERYVWLEKTDHLNSLTTATAEVISGKGAIIRPERFAGFSEEQRVKNSNLRIEKETEFLWVRAHSWVTSAPVWLPAQTVSGNAALHTQRIKNGEPTITHSTTNGLATRDTREGAVLHGALELIERDAYMIMWLNQLSLPQFDLEELQKRSATLSRLIVQCKRYKLRPHVIRLITDAPTYAVCAVIEDETPSLPHITLGLKAHKDPARAAEGALLEAMRGRDITRRGLQRSDWNPSRAAKDIGHYDRSLYWTVSDRAKNLAFLATGPIQNFTEPWEKDTDIEHLNRIISWCRARGYELVSIPLTHSKGNPTSLHIEVVVMPELQPIYLSERLPHLGGRRLKEIAIKFGHTPREQPFTDEPHPFI